MTCEYFYIYRKYLKMDTCGGTDYENSFYGYSGFFFGTFKGIDKGRA